MAAIETEHNDYECDKKTSPKSDFIKMGHKNKVLDQSEPDQNMSDFIKTGHENKVLDQIEPDQNLSLSRDTKIATNIQNLVLNQLNRIGAGK